MTKQLIRITADSTCDLSPELIRENNIAIKPMVVNMGDKCCYDGGDITPAEIFAYVAAGNPLCTTSAVSIGEYQDFFAEQLKDYDAIIHVNLGSGFSSTHRNAVLAAEEFENVSVVDSRNLSTGHGHVVLEACRLLKNAKNSSSVQTGAASICVTRDALWQNGHL